MSADQNDAVKIALVGCGAACGLYYASALRQLETYGLASLVAMVDPSAHASEPLQTLFPRAAVLDDIERAMQTPFDLAIVASPRSLHAQQTIQLLESGRNVLCEKPMATSVAAAQSMIAAAEASKGLLAIGMVRRFFPAAETVRCILAQQILGEIQSFHFAEGDASWPVASPNYFKKQEALGGVLMDLGVHALDLMLWWFGEPRQIDCQDDAMGGIEVNSRLRCDYGTFSGEISLSRDCALADRYVIRGSKGWLSWRVNQAEGLEFGFDDARFGLNAKLHFMETSGPHPQLSDQAFNFEQSFVSQLRNVIDAVRGREALRVGGAEGVRSLRLIERCYAQRSLVPMGWLDATEQSKARRLHAANHA